MKCLNKVLCSPLQKTVITILITTRVAWWNPLPKKVGEKGPVAPFLLLTTRLESLLVCLAIFMGVYLKRQRNILLHETVLFSSATRGCKGIISARA